MSTFVETWEMTECPNGHIEMRTQLEHYGRFSNCGRCGGRLTALWERQVIIADLGHGVHELVGPA